MAFKVTSDSFKDGDYLTKDFVMSADFGFGCAGGNKSPHLKWSGAPDGTKSFAITCYDPDARGRACGRCDSCQLRRAGFADAGVAVTVALAADAEALALSERVEHESHVLPDQAPVERVDVARVGRQVAVQELAERPLADEADSGRILLVVVRQSGAVCADDHVVQDA